MNQVRIPISILWFLLLLHPLSIFANPSFIIPGSKPEVQDKAYTPEEIQSASVEHFFKRIQNPEHGYNRFSAMWALTEKAKTGDAGVRKAIIDRAMEAVGDRSKPFQLRFQCCYLLSGIKDERAIPVLAKVLLEDKDQNLRGVAACALGDFTAEEARKALREAKEKEKDPGVLEDIKKALGDEAPELTFPFKEKRLKELPWPHQEPGVSKSTARRYSREVWVINDFPLYQADEKGMNRYFHGGLDIVLDNGTKIYAMKDGWVRALVGSTVVIADVKNDKPSYGWEYTHLGNFQVKKGDKVKKGTFIGEIEFDGLPHIHLTKVFSEGPHWGSWRYICMPNGHFTYQDEEPPTIRKPFYFFKNNSDEMIEESPSRKITVSGNVDIVVAMRDGGQFAHSKQNGFGDRLAVSKITYQIRSVKGGKKSSRSFNSFDFEKMKIKQGFFDKTYGTKLTKVVYKHWPLLEPDRPSGDKVFNFYIITNCEGSEAPDELNAQDREHCWHTAARDKRGKPLFPDGGYEIVVTACDFAGNRSEESMRVSVANE